MCIPHGSAGTKSNGYYKKQEKKHVERVSDEIWENSDPKFIDKRKVEVKSKKESFLIKIKALLK